jgi:hypothetical protein
MRVGPYCTVRCAKALTFEACGAARDDGGGEFDPFGSTRDHKDLAALCGREELEDKAFLADVSGPVYMMHRMSTLEMFVKDDKLDVNTIYYSVQASAHVNLWSWVDAAPTDDALALVMPPLLDASLRAVSWSNASNEFGVYSGWTDRRRMGPRAALAAR